MQSVATQIARLESKLGLDQTYRGDGTPSVWQLHSALNKIEARIFGNLQNWLARITILLSIGRYLSVSAEKYRVFRIASPENTKLKNSIQFYDSNRVNIGNLDPETKTIEGLMLSIIYRMTSLFDIKKTHAIYLTHIENGNFEVRIVPKEDLENERDYKHYDLQRVDDENGVHLFLTINDTPHDLGDKRIEQLELPALEKLASVEEFQTRRSWPTEEKAGQLIGATLGTSRPRETKPSLTRSDNEYVTNQDTWNDVTWNFTKDGKW